MPELTLNKQYAAVLYSNCEAKYFLEYLNALEYIQGDDFPIGYNTRDELWENHLGYIYEIKWEDND